ncbi:unnamed protein product [Lampetra fluviatilis]
MVLARSPPSSSKRRPHYQQQQQRRRQQQQLSLFKQRSRLSAVLRAPCPWPCRESSYSRRAVERVDASARPGRENRRRSAQRS